MRQKNIIIGSLLGLLLLMIVGYAAFSSVLKIKGTSSISSNWNILITNVTTKNIVGEATNATDPTWDALTANVSANLVSPGDSIEYNITIENRGNLNAVLEKITLTDSNNPAIKFTTSGLTEGDSLNAGSNAVLTLKVEYDASVTAQPENNEATLSVTLDYVQKDGIDAIDATYNEGYYYCPDEATLSGTQCNTATITTTSPNSSQSCEPDMSGRNYECGWDLSMVDDNVCYDNGKGVACCYCNYVTEYYCPSGYTSSGSGSSMTCTKTLTTTTEATYQPPYYTCPEGYTLSDTTCTKD